MSSSGSGRSRRFSRCSRSVSTALRSASRTRSRCSGFSRKSNAPRRVASTAVGDVGVAADHHHRQLDRALAQGLEHLEPVHLGHLDVEEHGVGRALGGARQRLAPGGGLLHAVALVLEDHAQAVADRGLVVDHEDRGPARGAIVGGLAAVVHES